MKMLGRLGLPPCPCCRSELIGAERHGRNGRKSKETRKRKIKRSERQAWRREVRENER